MENLDCFSYIIDNCVVLSPGLGTGGMIYYAVSIATVIYTTEECQDLHLLIHAISGLSFITVEIAILFKYSKVKISLEFLISKTVLESCLFQVQNIK